MEENISGGDSREQERSQQQASPEPREMGSQQAYPSARHLHDQAKDYYQQQFARNQALDTKLSILLAVFGVVFSTVVYNAFSFYDIVYTIKSSGMTLYTGDSEVVFFAIIQIALQLAAAIVFAFAFVRLIKALRTREYDVIKPSYLLDKQMQAQVENDYFMALTALYIQHGDENHQINEARSALFNQALKLLLIALLLIAIVATFKNNYGMLFS